MPTHCGMGRALGSSIFSVRLVKTSGRLVWKDHSRQIEGDNTGGIGEQDCACA